MPSKSPAQHRLMEGAAHSPAFAKKVGVPQKVGKEFAQDDQAGMKGGAPKQKGPPKPHNMALQKAQAAALMKPKPDMDGDGY